MFEVALGGFAMPVLSLVSATLAYAVDLFFATLSQLPIVGAKSVSELQGYAVIPITIAMVLGFMAHFDYFKDFANGLMFPLQAMVYAAGAIAGLIFFGSAIAGVTFGGIGTDAMISSEVSIAIMVTGAILSILPNRRSNPHDVTL